MTSPLLHFLLLSSSIFLYSSEPAKKDLPSFEDGLNTAFANLKKTSVKFPSVFHDGNDKESSVIRNKAFTCSQTVPFFCSALVGYAMGKIVYEFTAHDDTFLPIAVSCITTATTYRYLNGKHS